MYDFLFLGEETDLDHRAAGQLASALNAVYALHPERVEVVSGDGKTGVRLLTENDGVDRIEIVDKAPAVTEIHIRFGGGSLSIEDVSCVEGLLKAQCIHSDVELIVNGTPLSLGLFLDGVTEQIQLFVGC